MPNIIFREFSARPWLYTWCSLLLGFMHHLSLLPDDSLHLDILVIDIADARGHLCANWARGFDMQLATLGMASTYIASGIGAFDSHGQDA